MAATLVFDQESYAPSDQIRFQVHVDPEPMTRTVTVTGTSEAADGTELPAENVTTIHGVYGPFTTADGYTIAPDPADPSKFVMTPV